MCVHVWRLQQWCSGIDALQCCSHTLVACSGALCHLMQRKAVAWTQGAGRADVTSFGEQAKALRACMEECVLDALAAAVLLLSRMSPSPANQAQGSGGLVARWEAGAGQLAVDARWRWGTDALGGTQYMQGWVSRWVVGDAHFAGV